MFAIPLWLHLFGSAIGFSLGFIGALVFIFAYGNWHAGIWSMYSGLLALVCLHLHTLERYRTLDTKHSVKSLGHMAHLGIVSAGLGTVAMFVYFVSALVSHTPVVPVGPSLVLPAIQAFLTLKWGVALTYSAKKYKNMLENGYASME